MKTRYKFMYKKGRSIQSQHGDIKWKVGEWQHVDGEIRTCTNGLHCSKLAIDALSYVAGDVLAVVEVKGKSSIEKYKEAYSDMRIVKAYKWTKKDSVALAIYSAAESAWYNNIKRKTSKFIVDRISELEEIK